MIGQDKSLETQEIAIRGLVVRGNAMNIWNYDGFFGMVKEQVL